MKKCLRFLKRIEIMEASRFKKDSTLKTVDAIAYSLLLIGALNWGIIGLFDFNLVAAICGDITILTRFIYALVGLAAIYDLILLPSIFRRWEIHLRRRPAQA